MASGDNRRPEQPICRDANKQEDRITIGGTKYLKAFLAVTRIGGLASDHNKA